MTHSFHDQLRLETRDDEARFRAIPVIRLAVIAGVDRALYLAFLGSAYHHVRHTCPLLGLALSRCTGDDGPLRDGLMAYIDEEKGHEAWILDDIVALGGDRDRVAAALPPFPVRMMVAYANFAIERISPYAMLGMVHVLEGMSVALAHAAAESIGRAIRGRTDGPGFSYLRSHGAIDAHHVASFARLLDRIDRPARRQIVIQAARDFYRLYGEVFRDLGSNAGLADAA